MEASTPRTQMTQFVTMLVAVVALSATNAVPAVAEPLEPVPTAMGQRIEMPWADVAVRYPVDWEVLVTPEALPRTRAGRMQGPAIPIFPVLARGIAPEYEQRQEHCDLVPFDLTPRWQPLPLTTYDVASSLASLLLPGDSFGASEIDVPAGHASHLIQRTGYQGRDVFYSVFVIARDSGYVWLWCTSLDEAPDDDWLSIAETIEFLPEEEQAGSP